MAPVEWVDFDEAAQLAFFAWLTEAHGLDVSSLSRNNLVAEALRLHGAITLPEPRPPRFTLVSDGEAISPSGSVVSPEEVLATRGIFRVPASGAPDRDTRTFVAWPALCSELALLREGLRLGSDLATGRQGWKDRILRGEGRFHGLRGFMEDETVRRMGSADPATYLAQMWFISLITRHGHGLDVSPLPHGEKVRLAFRPATAAQQMWLTLAATAGFLDLPFPVDGLFSCEYPKCGRMFFANRSKARGTHRFCSERCGRRFHAVKSTRKRRAAESAKNKEGATQ
jgi:hypothetical protein